MNVLFTLSCLFVGLPLQQVLSQWVDNCPRQVLWNLRDTASNKSCILMAGTYDFVLPYQRESGQASSATVSISPNATITGTCGTNSSKIQSITLTWPVPAAPDSYENETLALKNVVTFTFSRNATNGRADGVSGFFCLQQVKAVLHSNPVEFRGTTEPNKMYTLEAANMELLSTALTMSYFCSTMQDVPVGEGTLQLAHTQIEVFHSSALENDGMDFGPRSYCLADGLRMLITAVVLISLLVATGGVVIYLFRRKAIKDNYTSLD
ncbi:unnamed protein product [Allacma fusca]|uniref:Lysosome-associated membrane glycoprotein 1 n=1 Tax=Allacma fusca TaxID=39272 RepID=A0A8J2KJI2_9HEXA|nr:unnamed protein product [Allacma fusca]